MSDYNKITDYSAKDALLSGDSVKRVKGSEIGADFDAVAVAVATKANSASPVFTGVSGFAVGAVGAPSIYMTGYATTGWYNIGANNWGFAVSGAKVLDIASTGMTLNGAFTGTTTAKFGTGAQNYVLDAYAAGASVVSSLTSDQAEAWLALKASGTTLGHVRIGASGANLLLYAGDTTIATVSSTGLAVKTAKFGTGAQNYVLDAYAAGASVVSSLTSDQAEAWLALKASGTTLGHVRIGASGANLLLYAGDTTIATVSSTGLAVTGGTFVNCSSAQGTEKFRADVASGSTEVARITCGDSGYESNMLVMNAARVANTAFSFQGGYANSALQYTILGNGNMQNVNNSYGATSDAKLKENITDATPKLADLLKVRIRNYNLKSDSSNKQIGVIAQELETIFPALVEETQDKDEAGVLLGTTTKAVKYSVFVPMLIKALQELNAKFEAYVESHP